MMRILSSEPALRIFMMAIIISIMKFLTEYLTYNVKSRRAFVNITSDVKKLIPFLIKKLKSFGSGDLILANNGMFEKLNVPIIGVVENMSHFVCSKCNEKHYIFGDGGAKRISEQFHIPFLGEIPLNSGIMSGSDLGKPIMITNPDSPSAQAFRSSAKNIAAQCSILASKLQDDMASENSNNDSTDSAKTS